MQCTNLLVSILISRMHQPCRYTSSDPTQHLDSYWDAVYTLVTWSPKKKSRFIFYTCNTFSFSKHLPSPLPPPPLPHTHTHSVAKDIKYGVWSPETGVYGDIDGGFPLVVFDSTMDNTVVLSPLSSFMSANQITFTDDQTGDKVLTFGPISSVNEVILKESFIWFIIYHLL